MKKYFPFLAACIASLVLLQTLYFKFTAQPESVILFSKLHMEPYGRIGVGIAELLASILLLLPKTRWIGGFLGLGLMSGAIFFHLTIIGIESNHDGGMLFILALITWCCCLYLCYRPVLNLLKKWFKGNTTHLLFLGFFLFTCETNLFAQGCSDAGFCSVGELKSEPTDSATQLDYKNKLGFIPALGIGENNTFIFTPALQYDRQLTKTWSIQTKFTLNYASGDLGSAFGLGDLIQSCSYAPRSEKKLKISFTAGVKIPLNNSNLSAGGRALPMTYQSSLGTLDAIAGIGLKFLRFKAAIGTQIPLINVYSSNSSISSNSFLPEIWNTDAANAYPATNGFKRAPDVLFKLEYTWKIGKKFTLIPGILNIYHLSEDRYVTGSPLMETRSINGSDGLTTNLILNASYSINKHLKAALTFGFPVIVREVRPDGLTRRFVLGPEISYQF